MLNVSDFRDYAGLLAAFDRNFTIRDLSLPAGGVTQRIDVRVLFPALGWLGLVLLLGILVGLVPPWFIAPVLSLVLITAFLEIAEWRRMKRQALRAIRDGSKADPAAES